MLLSKNHPSVKAIAAECGVSYLTAWKWINEGRTPNHVNALKLKAKFGIDLISMRDRMHVLYFRSHYDAPTCWVVTLDGRGLLCYPDQPDVIKVDSFVSSAVAFGAMGRALRYIDANASRVMITVKMIQAELGRQ